MKCILHIGLQKCGSSSLQLWLDKNRDALLRQGVLYPRSLGQRSQIGLTAMGMGFVPGHWIVQETGAQSATEFDRWQAEREAAFAEELAAQAGQARVVVISQEDLGELPSVGADRVWQILKRHMTDMTVVGYVRPAADLANSWLNQNVRNGVMRNAEAYLQSYRAPFLRTARHWADAAGQVRWRALAQVPDIVDDICDLLALDPTPLGAAERVNEALTPEQFQLLADLTLPMRIDGRKNQNRALFLGERPGSRKFKMPRAWATEIEARALPNVEAFLEFAPDVPPDALRCDMSSYPEDAVLTWDTPAYAQEMGDIIARLNAQIWLERVNAKLSAAKTMLVQGDLNRAGRQISAAEQCMAHAAQVDVPVVNAALSEQGKRLNTLRDRLAHMQRKSRRKAARGPG